MKIDENTRFPYPTLSGDTNDFSSGRFDVEFTVREDEVANTLTLVPVVRLSHSLFDDLLSRGKVKIKAAVHCGSTYFSQLVEVKDGKIIAFQPGRLSERVTIRPLLIASEEIEAEAPEDLVPEYGLSKLKYQKGQVVGWSDLHVISVGKRKLAKIESIFEIARNDSLDAGEISVDPGSDKIRIYAAPETFEHIDLMRKSGATQAVILNSVYLPAIMSVMDSVKGGDFKGYDWYRTFQAKCEFHMINLESADLLADAQKLLGLPYKKIQAAYSE